MPVTLLGTERVRCGIPSGSRRTAAARLPEPCREATVTTEEERDAEFEEAFSALRLVMADREVAELRKAGESTVRGFTDGSRPWTIPVGTRETTRETAARSSARVRTPRRRADRTQA
ncbi:hypothetical protein ACFC5Z_06165 [Streptomyces sp. NPDC056004]|uniref:hypothetical protein n=1 Tax=Streptomyces sp. NPDC056004 TaxID=3345677 RepID=UPI0035DA589E